MSHHSAIVRSGLVVAALAAVSGAQAQELVLRPGGSINLGDVVEDTVARQVVLLESGDGSAVVVDSVDSTHPAIRADLARQAGQVVIDLRFEPQAPGAASSTVTVRGVGGAPLATLSVTGNGVDASAPPRPRFTSIPLTLAVLGRDYAYNTEAVDTAAGVVRYDLDVAPTGMTVHSGSGTIRWVPQAGQEGARQVVVRATNLTTGASGTQTFWVNAVRLDVAVAAGAIGGTPEDDYTITVGVSLTPPRLVTVSTTRMPAQSLLRIEHVVAGPVLPGSIAPAPTSVVGDTITWNLQAGTTTQTTHVIVLPPLGEGDPPTARPLSVSTSARLGTGAGADSLEVASNLLASISTDPYTPTGLSSLGGGKLLLADGVADAQANQVVELDRWTQVLSNARTVADAPNPQDVDVGTGAGLTAVVDEDAGTIRRMVEHDALGNRVRWTRTDTFGGADLRGFAVDPSSGDRFFVSSSQDRLYRFDRHFGDHFTAVGAGNAIYDVAGDTIDGQKVVWAVGLEGTTAHLYKFDAEGALLANLTFTGSPAPTRPSGVAVNGDTLLVLDNPSAARRLFRVDRNGVVQGWTPATVYGASLSGLDRDPVTGEVLLVSASDRQAVRLGPDFGDHVTPTHAAPGGVGFDAGRNQVWVVDCPVGTTAVKAVVALSSDGSVAESWNATRLNASTGAVENLERPFGVAFDAARDEVLILDAATNTTAANRYVYAYSRQGELRRRTAVSGSGISTQAAAKIPHGIELDAAGDLLIVHDDATDDVVEVGAQFLAHEQAPSGTISGVAVGRPGELWTVENNAAGQQNFVHRSVNGGAYAPMFDTGLADPTGIAVALGASPAQDRIFVVDRTTKQLNVYDAAGAVLETRLLPTSPAIVPAGLDYDDAMAQLLVVEDTSTNGAVLERMFRLDDSFGGFGPTPAIIGTCVGMTYEEVSGTYWAAFHNAGTTRVLHFDANGVDIEPPFAVTGQGRGVAFGNGRVHVLFAGSPTARVITYLPGGGSPVTTTLSGGAPAMTQFLCGLALSADGQWWYVLENNTGTTVANDFIRSFPVQSGTSTVAATIPLGLMVINNPIDNQANNQARFDLAVRPDGKFAILDDANGGSPIRVHVLDAAGVKEGEVLATNSGCADPRGLSANGTDYHLLDNMNLATTVPRRVFSMPQAGIGYTPTTTAAVAPTGIAVDGADVYVIDNGTNDRVSVVGTPTQFSCADFGALEPTGLDVDGADLVASTSAAVALYARVHRMSKAHTAWPRTSLPAAITAARGVCPSPDRGGYYNYMVVNQVPSATTDRVYEVEADGDLVGSFSTGEYGCLDPTGLALDGDRFRVCDDVVPTVAEPNRVFAMRDGGLKTTFTPLPVGTFPGGPEDVLAHPSGTMLVVDITGVAVQYAAPGSGTGPWVEVSQQDLRTLGITFETANGFNGLRGAGYDTDGNLRFCEDMENQVYRTSAAGVVMRTYDLPAGVSGITGLAYDGVDGKLFLNNTGTVFEACVDDAKLVVGPRVALGLFQDQGVQLDTVGITDVAVDRVAREIYVTSASQKRVYVFSMGEHQAPNPARVLMLAAGGDAGAFADALTSRGHSVTEADLAPGALQGGLDQYSQVWIVADGAGGSLSSADRDALQAWTGTADRPHVVVDGLATRDQSPCGGIRYSQDLASALELNGGGVMLVAGVEQGASSSSNVNLVLERLGFSGRVTGSYSSQASSLVGRGDMVTLTWLSTWFTGTLDHAEVPEGGTRELYSSLVAAYSAGSPVPSDGSLVVLSSTIRAAAGVADVTAGGVSEPVNRVSPTITIVSPAAGAVLGASGVSFQLDYSDDIQLDLGTLTILVDGVDRTADFTVSPGAPTATATATATLTLGDGPHTVSTSVEDVHDNLASASSDFTVDTAPPVITASDVLVEQVNAAGTPVSVQVSVVDAVDPSPVVTVDGVVTPLVNGQLTIDRSYPYPLGPTSITVVATDAGGKSSTRLISVQVQDTVAPTFTSTPGGQVLEATGPGGAVATFAQATASDACDAAVDVTCSHASGSTFPLGSTDVTCAATDDTGNTATSTFTIQVRDTTPPSFVNPPAALTYEQTNPDGTPISDFGLVATDLVSAVTITYSAGVFPLGVTTSVTATATDAAGNSSTHTFTVTIEDTTAPTITAPLPDLGPLQATGPGTPVTFGAPGVSDVCDAAPAVTFSPASGSDFAVGTTTVTYTVTDASGNSTSDTFTVTVVDETPPILTLPGPFEVEQADADGAVVDYVPPPSAVDNVDPAPALSVSPPSGTKFPLGTHTVTVIAVDASNNAASGTFTVRVTDTTAPTLGGLPTDPIMAVAVDATGAYVTYTFTPTSTDVCDASPTITYSHPSDSLFPVGTTVVTATATDDSGNATSGTFTVIVEDQTPPVIGPLSDYAFEQTSAAGAVVTFPLPTATDNVDTPEQITVTTSPASGATLQLGTHTVTVTATDRAGNSSTGTFTVRVEDHGAPTLAAPADPAPVEATGPAGAVVTFATPVAGDLCDADPVEECSPPSGSTFPIGATSPTVTPVTVTARDGSGNVTTVTFNVTVQDTTPPALSHTPPSSTHEQGHAGGTAVEYTMPTATDLVDPAPVVVTSHPSGSVFPNGTTTVTITATDRYGNSSSVSFTVTVQDTLDPVLTLPGDLVGEQTNAGGAHFEYAPTAHDQCDSDVDVVCEPPTPCFVPLGQPFVVTVTATDNSGNTTTGSFTLTTIDTSAPTLTVPADLTVTAESGSSVPATHPEVAAWLASASATDVCDSNPTVTDDAPETFTGTTVVTFTATDHSGHQVTGQARLTVRPANTDATVEIVKPAEGTCTPCKVTVEWVVTPAGTPVTLSGTRTKGNRTYSLGAGPTYEEEGDYHVVATAAGGATDDVRFRIDRTRPVVDITSPVADPHQGPYPYSEYRVAVRPSKDCADHDHECKKHDECKGKGHDKHGCGKGDDCDDDRDRDRGGCKRKDKDGRHDDDCDDRRDDRCDGDRRDGDRRDDDRRDGCDRDRHGDGCRGRGDGHGHHDDCGRRDCDHRRCDDDRDCDRRDDHRRCDHQDRCDDRPCCSRRVPSDLPIRVSYTAHDEDGISGGVSRVDMKLDGVALDSATTRLDAATFIRLGLPVLGRHTLSVRAADCAGNVGEDCVQFEVALYADLCARVMSVSDKDSSKDDKHGKKDKKDKDKKGESDLITIKLDLPAPLTGSSFDPDVADVVRSTLRLEAVSTRRSAAPVSVTVDRGVLTAKFKEKDLKSDGKLGTLFRLTGRFFSSTGAAFVAEGELTEK